jgi:hemerythrin-like domain-containing protein
MKKAASDLEHEHEAILLALRVMEIMCNRLESNQVVHVQDVTNIIEFLKIFADKCHHGKEEGFLFPYLENIGIRKQNGPIGVMLAEHVKGREFIKQMQESVLNNKIQKEIFIKAASDYVNLLRYHINKENNILFPLSDSKLPESQQKELLNAFEEFEERVIGKGKHKELHRMLEDFEDKYLIFNSK